MSEVRLRDRIPTLAAILVALFLFLPILIVVPMSFSTAVSFQFPPPGYSMGYYRAYFSDPTWLAPTANSFIVATATMVLTMLLSVPAAFAYVRKRFVGRTAVNLLIMLPLIVPPVVSALAFYGYLGRAGLTGTLPGMVMAHVSLAIPVSFLVLCATLKGFDRNLERAAMISGAGPVRTFFLVTMPTLRSGMVTASMFAFLASFNEAVVAIFISGRDAGTLPRKMFESIQLDADPVIAVVSTLLIGGVLLGVVVSSMPRRRSQSRTAAVSLRGPGP